MTTSHRIFVVDDEDMIRDSIVEFLDENGYEAVGAAHGRDALDKLTASEPRPCLILLDLMMPVMDGRSFREEQLQTPELAAIPVVLFSAYRDALASLLSADANWDQARQVLERQLEMTEEPAERAGVFTDLARTAWEGFSDGAEASGSWRRSGSRRRCAACAASRSRPPSFSSASPRSTRSSASSTRLTGSWSRPTGWAPVSC